MQFLKDLWARLNEPTPEFFVVIRKISALMFLISGLFLMADKSEIGEYIPEFVKKLFSFWTLNSAGIAILISSFASRWRNANGSLNLRKKKKYLDKKKSLKEVEKNIDVG